MLVARKDLPPNDLREFIAYAKANQATINYSSGGAGSSSHLACALLNAAIGVKVTHIPYRGGGPALADLSLAATTTSARRSGRRCSRSSEDLQGARAADQGARAEPAERADRARAGRDDFTADFWIALFLPKGTPVPIVRRLNAAAVEAMNTPSVRSASMRSAPIWSGRSAVRQISAHLVEREIEKYAGPIKAAGLAGG